VNMGRFAIAAILVVGCGQATQAAQDASTEDAVSDDASVLCAVSNTSADRG
jgi:hypothetical protein